MTTPNPQHKGEARTPETEALLQAIERYALDTLSGRTDGPEDREWFRDGFMEIVRRCRAAELSAQESKPVDGYTMIPNSALRWLFGEEGDFECPPENYFRGRPPAFWWRGEFQKRIDAAPSVSAQDASPKDGWQQQGPPIWAIETAFYRYCAGPNTRQTAQDDWDDILSAAERLADSREQCPSCMGHGSDLGWSCPYCAGTGFVLAAAPESPHD